METENGKDAAMDAIWHYAKDGAAAGPVDENRIREEIAAGNVRPDTLVWKPGEAQWRRASDFFGFGGAADLPPPLATSSSAAAAAKVPTRLGLSIASMLFFLPFGVVALVYSTKAGTANAAGDAEAARAAAARASSWALAAVVAGVVLPFVLGAAAAVLVLAVA